MSINLDNSIWQKLQQGVFVIAEIGKNFIQTEKEQTVDVYLENAKKLAAAAKQAGADAVKFQTHNVDDEVLNIRFTSPHFKTGERYNWVLRNTQATPLEFWQELKNYCDSLGIVFFSTPMSRGAAEKLAQVGTELWKVGSGDILDFPMLDFICKHGAPLILSTGMSTLSEIDAALNFVRPLGTHMALLHCVSEYPCPPERLNLKTIEFFKQRYDIPIGFSDHSLEHETAAIAVALGAKIIEKHFSFDRNFYGADHKTSLLPHEFEKMARAIQNVQALEEARKEILQSDTAQKSLGTCIKTLQDTEAKYRPLFRKSLVAACDIPLGAKLTPEMLYAMRPQSLLKGLPSEKYPEVIGRMLKKPLKKYEAITFDVLL